jgi:uncharacterized membrane protein
VWMIFSLAVKAIMSQTQSIFNNKNVTDQQSVKDIILNTVDVLVFAVAELGYIFYWVIIEKPYELYSVLNMDKCKL